MSFYYKILMLKNTRKRKNKTYNDYFLMWYRREKWVLVKWQPSDLKTENRPNNWVHHSICINWLFPNSTTVHASLMVPFPTEWFGTTWVSIGYIHSHTSFQYKWFSFISLIYLKDTIAWGSFWEVKTSSMALHTVCCHLIMKRKENNMKFSHHPNKICNYMLKA